MVSEMTRQAKQSPEPNQRRRIDMSAVAALRNGDEVHQNMSRHIMSCHIVSCRVMSCYVRPIMFVMSCHEKSCHVRASGVVDVCVFLHA